ncbi:hypothetical protein PGSY75_1028900 [Plasmodium gaboni]|uniref:Inner membrane complex protein 1m n=1 Tax=Plasmodium gaboni TaxID=647221 RepID=A0A151LLE0_9APIC|nr:hypothetical protein PGSY75_1028900 [Plasmodium gaboni]KYN99669.1 hypothetical protein PGSY75_1028900 [Plasmodium gaboni]
MCDNNCEDKKNYMFGPPPFLLSQNVVDSASTTVELDYPLYETGKSREIKNIIQETTINIPKVEYKNKIVEIPRVQYRTYPLIKEVETPIYKDKYVYKNVEVPNKRLRIKPVYREVKVPEIKYVDKYVKRKYKRYKYIPKEIKVPFRPRREIYNEIPIPRYIPENIENCLEKKKMLDTAYRGELPLFQGYDDNIVNMMNPFCTYNQSDNLYDNKMWEGKRKEKEKEKTWNYDILNCLCINNNENETYDNKLYEQAYDPNMIYSSSPYEQITYTPPYQILLERDQKKEEDLFCHKIIEVTSSLLAFTGIAIILMGKLSLHGISLVMKHIKDTKNNNNNNTYLKKNKNEIKDDEAKQHEDITCPPVKKN